MWNLKKYSKLVNIARKNSRPTNTESWWLPAGGWGNTGVGRRHKYQVQMGLEGCIIQHGEYSQCFITK